MTLDEIQAIHEQWRESEERLSRADESEDAFRALIEDDPDFPVARFQYGQILWRQGEIVAAAEQFFAALELGLNHPDVLTTVQGALRTLESAGANVADMRGRYVAALSKPEPKLALAMIAKDEEEYLAQCLASVTEIVDQVVVVDTGSTDATRDIAKEHGADVHCCEWHDDFSAARNESLKYVAGDWVLWLDADEELTREAVEPLRRLIRDPEIAGAHLRIDNLMGSRAIPFLTTRLWRHHETIRFKQPIHEQILWSISPYARRFGRRVVEAPDVVIRHYGYQPSVAATRGKESRNIQMLKRLVEQEPDNAYALFHYASNLRETGELKQALEAFDRWRRLAFNEDASQYHWLRVGFANGAGTLNDAGRYDDALDLIERAIEKVGDTVSLRYQRALALHRLNRHEEALSDLQAAERIPRDVSASVESVDFQPLLVPLLTAEVYIALGRREDARRLFEDALSSHPKDPRPRLGLARLHIAANELDEAAERLEAALQCDPDEPGVLSTLGQVELFRRRFRNAVELLEKAAARDSQGEASRMLGEAHLIMGNREKAREVWEASSESAAAAGARAFVALSNGEIERVEDLRDKRAASGFWSLVAKIVMLNADEPTPGAEAVLSLARRVASEPRLQPLRADLLKLFLKHRFREGVAALRS